MKSNVIEAVEGEIGLNRRTGNSPSNKGDTMHTEPYDYCGVETVMCIQYELPIVSNAAD